MASTDSLVFVESVDANSLAGETPLEHLRSAGDVVIERGHRAEEFARTASGTVLTPHGFADRAIDVHPATGRMVAARRMESSEWGLAAGADYVARHWIGAMGQDPDNFLRLETSVWAQLYAGRGVAHGPMDAVARAMFGNVSDVRLAPDGLTALTLEWLRDPNQSVYAIFRHDLATGEHRLLNRLHGAAEEAGDVDISRDGRFALLGSPTPQLLDLTTGHCGGLGQGLRAAAWYPKAGDSCILGVTGDHHDPPWELVVLDLSTFRRNIVAKLPRRVDGLTVAADGTIAARMNPAGEAGWFDELVVSVDDGRSFEPVVPLCGRSGWRRRSTRPRWIEDVRGGPVRLDPHFESFLREVRPDTTSERGEIDWILDLAASKIKHRVVRLTERPQAADIMIGELRVLTALAAMFDNEMLDAVGGQVVPVVRAAAVTARGIEDAGAIASVAARIQAPSFHIRFGEPSEQD